MIKYHFFGKECIIDRSLTDYSDLTKNLTKQNFISSFPPIFVNQIHGADVLVIDSESKIPPQINRPKADAIVTNLKSLTIALITADCTPVLFYDEKNSIIAAAHAGWPGAFQNITDNVIKEMLSLGAKLENIVVIIGPTVRQKSYEISEEFYERFVNENPSNEKFFIEGERAGHHMFDLPSYVKEKLKNAGIKNIFDEEIDTYSNQEKLFSYRRSTHLKETDCGRNVSVIQII